MLCDLQTKGVRRYGHAEVSVFPYNYTTMILLLLMCVGKKLPKILGKVLMRYPLTFTFIASYLFLFYSIITKTRIHI